jgi:DNA-binding NtrC family response regulator
MTDPEHQPIAPGPRRTVLILNGFQDLLDMMRIALENAGFAVMTGDVDHLRRGHLDLKGIISQYAPVVVVYDVSPPYDRNWMFLEALRSSGPLAGLPLVLTSTNERRLRELVATSEPVIEVFGKPFDLLQLMDAVKRAAGE